MTQRSMGRGYTLVEALVVVALVVVVLGMALDAFIETNRAAQAVSDNLVCAREAQAICHSIENYLKSTMFDAPTSYEFSKELLKLTAIKAQKSLLRTGEIEKALTDFAPRPVKVTIRNDLERRRVLAEESDLGKTHRLTLGNNADAFCAEVSFAYAEQIRDFTPQWQDASTTVPKLAKIRVRVWPRLPGFNTFEDARKASQPRYAELDYWVRVQ